MIRPIHLALATSFCMAACAAPADPSVRGVVVAKSDGAQFDVEVRYAGGLTKADAQAMLRRIEVLPARELFPDADLSKMPSIDDEEPLDATEPTLEVVLHPMNEAAARERHAWRESIDPSAAVGSDESIGQSRQGLNLNVAVGITLEPGESWRTARHRCYAPFVFGAEFVGPAKVCIDLGAQGLAGSNCSYQVDPREPVIVVHPGPDANPFNKHYFRGRVTGMTLFGHGLPAIGLAGYACL